MAGRTPHVSDDPHLLSNPDLHAIALAVWAHRPADAADPANDQRRDPALVAYDNRDLATLLTGGRDQCEHGVPAGARFRPEHGTPACPLCRKASLTRSQADPG
jgi:hypothetical protein